MDGSTQPSRLTNATPNLVAEMNHTHAKIAALQAETERLKTYYATLRHAALASALPSAMEDVPEVPPLPPLPVVTLTPRDTPRDTPRVQMPTPRDEPAAPSAIEVGEEAPSIEAIFVMFVAELRGCTPLIP